jgi:hypothetical protein
MIKECFADRFADLGVRNPRQEFDQVRHAATYGGYTFRLQLFYPD